MPSARNDVWKVLRSAGVILSVCLLWPLFFWLAHVGADVGKLPAQFVGLLYGGPAILAMLLVAFIVGTFIPSLVVGALMALFSPSIANPLHFLATSTLIGAFVTPLLMASFNILHPLAPLLAAEGALASFLCAVAVLALRPRPL
jgi:hypothetical protein